MNRAIDSSCYFDLVDIEEPVFVSPLFSSEFFMPLANVEVSVAVSLDETDDDLRVYTELVRTQLRAEKMKIIKTFLHVDVLDIPVMVGAALFFSSVTGVCWSLAGSSPAPSGLGIAAALGGLAVGKYVSTKSRLAR